MSQEKQVFTKKNLSDLLRLAANAIDNGEELELEEGRLINLCLNHIDTPFYTSENKHLKLITLKSKPQLRKATALEWLEWACSDECKGWAVRYENDTTRAPQNFNYLVFDQGNVAKFKRAKFENGKLGEFDYFWVEV